MKKVIKVKTQTWTDGTGTKLSKRRFKEKYGRKPTKEEIKMLKKGEIDVGPIQSHSNLAETIWAKTNGGLHNRTDV